MKVLERFSKLDGLGKDSTKVEFREWIYEIEKDNQHYVFYLSINWLISILSKTWIVVYISIRLVYYL